LIIIYRKNGVPRNAVTIPTGISITAMCDAIRSHIMSRMAPKKAE